MVLIIGEVDNDEVIVCFLERFTDIWNYQDYRFRVPAFEPTFLKIKLNRTDRTVFSFQSDQTGKILTGSVTRFPSTAWVVSCNNRHVIRPCTIWPKISYTKTDIVFHLGDQIYADRIYWRWWRYLCNMNPSKWHLYQKDIQMEYHREYIETWEPLQSVFAHSSNIMIPDDHEIRSRASLWECLSSGKGIHGLPHSFEYYLGGASGKKFRSLTEQCFDTALSFRNSDLESFLFDLALEVCKNLYLGLRLTNRGNFDYFKVINNVNVIMHERITQPFISESFQKNCQTFLQRSSAQRILFMGGLPPVPIRPNFFEVLFYRYTNTIDDEQYIKLYELFQDRPSIYLGGDLHVGVAGEIILNGKNLGQFHIASPSSGFCSIYIPQDSIGSPNGYQLRINQYSASNPNAVQIDLEQFKSKHVFSPGSFVEAWQNTLSAGLCFWSD